MITIGKQSYSTLQEAINTIPDQNTTPTTIHVGAGRYQEVVTLNKDFVTLEGEDPQTTIITASKGAKEILEDGQKRGTFRSFTLLALGHHITLEKLTIENTAGQGDQVGQAIALYAEGDQIVVNDCNILGHQDTLFTGPLPPKEIEPNGFLGPTQFAPRTKSHQQYNRCKISGTVDFIFGSAIAIFDQCIIESLPTGHPVEGYITAPSTPQGQAYGYVFIHCSFVSSCPKASVYLGRPWRDYAKCVILKSELGEHIKPEGWFDWNKPLAQKETFFAEGQNTGNGSKGNRVPWSHTVCVEDYSKDKIWNA